MKNYDEYMDHIRSKAKNIKKRRRIATSCALLLVLTLALTLFVPYRDQLPNVDRYKNSPYYKLIPGLNKATYQPPAHKNNYEWLVDALSFRKYAPGDAWVNGDAAFDAPMAAPEADGSVSLNYGVSSALGGADQKYEEVTDNQVQGVTESDLFKRSDKYIYYLRGNDLSVYSIDKENSAEIAALELPMEENVYSSNFEMFLSQDCTTLTVLSRQSTASMGVCTVVYSLNVSDPANIQMQEPLYFKGNFITARMVGNDLLLIYNYRVTGEIDFDKPETFVPVYGTQSELQPIAPEDIYCPAEEPTSARYTVIAKLDAKTLQVKDTAALLSYSTQVYVSQTAIYATYSCTRSVENQDILTETAITEITGISYTGDELKVLGTITVDGSVKDQYSMDEYNGILRVATSTSTTTRQQRGNEENVWVSTTGRTRNCNLYCIDLRTWEIAASVIAFAPDGEEVTSARFDGPMGYICTAEVIILTDPVYFFDLRDIHNITYKQTPIIDGYSSSLINFGDFLLGIGINEERELKVEIYEETADGVEPIASYELPAFFSEEYKSYYIDRENNLVGIPICLWSDGKEYYLLLHFDGYELRNMKDLRIDGIMNAVRADIIDGYLYLLEETLQVVKLW